MSMTSSDVESDSDLSMPVRAFSQARIESGETPPPSSSASSASSASSSFCGSVSQSVVGSSQDIRDLHELQTNATNAPLKSSQPKPAASRLSKRKSEPHVSTTFIGVFTPDPHSELRDPFVSSSRKMCSEETDDDDENDTDSFMEHSHSSHTDRSITPSSEDFEEFPYSDPDHDQPNSYLDTEYGTDVIDFEHSRRDSEPFHSESDPHKRSLSSSSSVNSGHSSHSGVSAASHTTVSSMFSFTDDEADRACLFIGDLSRDCTDEALAEAFRGSDTGLIRAWVKKDKSTGNPLGYGFAQFARREQAALAKKAMQGSVICSRTCRIGWARRNTTILVHDLSPDAQLSDVLELFEPYGELIESECYIFPRFLLRCGVIPESVLAANTALSFGSHSDSLQSVSPSSHSPVFIQSNVFSTGPVLPIGALNSSHPPGFSGSVSPSLVLEGNAVGAVASSLPVARQTPSPSNAVADTPSSFNIQALHWWMTLAMQHGIVVPPRDPLCACITFKLRGDAERAKKDLDGTEIPPILSPVYLPQGESSLDGPNGPPIARFRLTWSDDRRESDVLRSCVHIRFERGPVRPGTQKDKSENSDEHFTDDTVNSHSPSTEHESTSRLNEFDVDEDELRRIFSPFGRVHRVNIPRSTSGRFRGFAFVHFDNSLAGECAADEAIRSLHFSQINGLLLQCKPGKRRFPDRPSDIQDREYCDVRGSNCSSSDDPSNSSHSKVTSSSSVGIYQHFDMPTPLGFIGPTTELLPTPDRIDSHVSRPPRQNHSRFSHNSQNVPRSVNFPRNSQRSGMHGRNKHGGHQRDVFENISTRESNRKFYPQSMNANLSISSSSTASFSSGRQNQAISNPRIIHPPAMGPSSVYIPQPHPIMSHEHSPMSGINSYPSAYSPPVVPAIGYTNPMAPTGAPAVANSYFVPAPTYTMQSPSGMPLPANVQPIGNSSSLPFYPGVYPTPSGFGMMSAYSEVPVYSTQFAPPFVPVGSPLSAGIPAFQSSEYYPVPVQGQSYSVSQRDPSIDTFPGYYGYAAVSRVPSSKGSSSSHFFPERSPSTYFGANVQPSDRRDFSSGLKGMDPSSAVPYYRLASQEAPPHLESSSARIDHSDSFPFADDSIESPSSLPPTSSTPFLLPLPHRSPSDDVT